MRVVPVDQLVDNYAYLLISGSHAAVVDVAEAAPVLDCAEAEEVTVVSVLSTHHHYDHVGGNEDLVAELGRRGEPEGGPRVFGYAGDRERIPELTDGLGDGEQFEVAGMTGQAIFIPAHTRGHLAYYFAAAGAVFTGDTLFAGGCGRLFEGDAGQMMSSLATLADLPDDTLVYCGHEYTAKNLEFAAMLEPGNRALEQRRHEVAGLLAGGKPTVPTTIGLEKQTNPFLRTGSAELRRSVIARVPGTADDDTAVFAATRSLKDAF